MYPGLRGSVVRSHPGSERALPVSPDPGRIEGDTRAARVGRSCLSPSAERFARTGLRGCPSLSSSDTRRGPVSPSSLCTLRHLPPQGNPGHYPLSGGVQMQGEGRGCSKT